jgi:hypothetical protein
MHIRSSLLLPFAGLAAIVCVLAAGTVAAPEPLPVPDVPDSVRQAADTNIDTYSGAISHIFFHSLIIYPQKAAADAKNIRGYRENMITAGQFQQILEQLYAHGFILIDANLLYSVREGGGIRRNALRMPKGKKPLILSVDDLSYYDYMKNGGFADKLVLDGGTVKTEVRTPDGKTILTEDGDVVPIVDAFVRAHPDFSPAGAKGIIGVTGFEGILGYRTQLTGEHGDTERRQAKLVADALKRSGWTFANHSYGHERVFRSGAVSAAFLAHDLSLWADQVKPLVGETAIFIGPFGQLFPSTDPRRAQLVDAGYVVLFGVGRDEYLRFFDRYLVMDRVDIDGYRLAHDAEKLREMFGISVAEAF